MKKNSYSLVTRMKETAMVRLNRATAYTRAEGLMRQIDYHLAKLTYLGSNPHWKTEVRSWISQVSNIEFKSGKTRLSIKDFFELGLDDFQEDVWDGVIGEISVSFTGQPVRDKTEARKLSLRIKKDIAEACSRRYVTIEEAQKLLDKHL